MIITASYQKNTEEGPLPSKLLEHLKVEAERIKKIIVEIASEKAPKVFLNIHTSPDRIEIKIQVGLSPGNVLTLNKFVQYNEFKMYNFPEKSGYLKIIGDMLYDIRNKILVDSMGASNF